MKDKIAYLMKSEGLTTTRFAEILEIQPSAVSHLVSGRNKPGFDLLQKILRRFPRLNPDWLLLDSEEPYRQDQDDEGDSEGSPTPYPDVEPRVDLFSQRAVIPNPLSSITPSTPPGNGSKSPIFVVIFYDDGSCERFSL